jgi:hypothetical protein
VLYSFVIEENLDLERRKASKQQIGGSNSCPLFLLWRRVHALDERTGPHLLETRNKLEIHSLQSLASRTLDSYDFPILDIPLLVRAGGEPGAEVAEEGGAGGH